MIEEIKSGVESAIAHLEQPSDIEEVRKLANTTQ